VIYYITKINMLNHDETVMTSHDNLERAVNAHSGFVAANTDENVTFRIDTVLTGDEIKEANKRNIPAKRDYVKEELNRKFARAKMDHEEGYPDTDSNRTEDFTDWDIFGDVATDREYLICVECAAMIPHHPSHRAVHVAWHNKLLP
jgi:hypothetical protein